MIDEQDIFPQTLVCSTVVKEKKGDTYTFTHTVDINDFPLNEQIVMDCLREYKRVLFEKLK